MAFGKGKTVAVIDGPPVVRARTTPRSLVASAVSMKFDDMSYNNYRFRDETWQRELWRLYDIIPEFAYAARWVGACCSQVRIYVAEVDKLGRVQGETTDEKINALSDTLLGGPDSKAEALRSIGINMTVAGEAYILGRTDDLVNKDEWFILSSSEFRRVRNCGDDGGTCIGWGDKYFPQIIDLSRQVVTRVWSPHPQRIWLADSPSRSCQPVLRELEQLTKYVFSQIDSRLVGAGMLVIPNNLDFPADDNVDVSPSSADTLMMKLATAGAASLRGEGTAMAVLPMIVEANPEDVERGFKLIEFASELSKQAMELRDEAIRRLATGMDMPAEALTGMGDTNHWNGWFIDGYGIKVHIEPLMNRICQALTKAYLIPALKLMKKDPARFQFSFDTAPLAVRPQRLQDALNLYEKEIISADAVRDAGNFKASDAPGNDELASRRVFDVVLRDPNLFQKLGVREIIGVSEKMLPQDEFIMATPGLGGSGPGAPPPPAPVTGIQSELPPPIPNTLGEIPPPKGTPPGGGPTTVNGNGPNLTAAIDPRRELGLVVLAEAAVRRGMEVAGKRLLDRHNRDRWPDVPHFDLHTRIRVTDGAHATRLLGGAWDQLNGLVELLDSDVDPERLRQSLHRYCCTLLTTSSPHVPQNLLAMLRAEGLIHGS